MFPTVIMSSPSSQLDHDRCQGDQLWIFVSGGIDRFHRISSTQSHERRPHHADHCSYDASGVSFTGSSATR
jgi:hypothetical protein